MIGNKLKLFAVVALLLLLSIMLTGCGDGNGDEDRGLSRAEVEENVQSAMAEVPDPTPGLSQAEASLLLQDALFQLPQANQGLTRADIEEIVSSAIAESVLAGLETTIEYYNNAETVQGEWFAFMADSNDTLVGHNDPELISQSLTDLYLFRLITQEFTEEGVWVAVEAIDSATGNLESMRSWVVRYGGVTCAAGWYSGEPES